MKRITLHGLRHTYATQVLAAGVPPHVASERLGRSSVAFTLQISVMYCPGRKMRQRVSRTSGDHRGPFAAFGLT